MDKELLRRLNHQRLRRQACLNRVPPDRAEAARCLRRIDDMLDRRPRPIAVATDGEIVLDDQSPWVQKQVHIVKNDTDTPERILTAEQYKEMMGE